MSEPTQYNSQRIMHSIAVNSGQEPALVASNSIGYSVFVSRITGDSFQSRGIYRAGTRMEADLAASRTKGTDIFAQLGIRPEKERTLNCGPVIYQWIEKGHEIVTITAFPAERTLTSKPLEGMIEVFSRPRT